PAAADPNNLAEPLYRKPNISAPGSAIRSALRGSDGEYGSLSGTSMAGPHVAGLVALVISANPELSGKVDRIEEIIEATAEKKTTSEACGGDSGTQVPNNTYGAGRIDALAAVAMAAATARVGEIFVNGFED
ncbi:MAG TPA: S8 family serine peptidase, partial [Candidatus Saccharimonadia bacterium]|nr:S8 family serine peptidase [Candidatus Saccharimonadia bacterium]